jgi:hypothetical protein
MLCYQKTTRNPQGPTIIVGSKKKHFYLTLLSGNIPKVWESAFVLPLNKGVVSSDLNNYRPI